MVEPSGPEVERPDKEQMISESLSLSSDTLLPVPPTSLSTQSLSKSQGKERWTRRIYQAVLYTPVWLPWITITADEMQ